MASYSNPIPYLPRLRSNDPALTQINLSDKNIGDKATSLLAAALATNSTLTSLSLASNKITDVGAESLANALLTNSTLLGLDLYNNKITDQGAECIATALASNSTLTQLFLAGNHIADGGARSLAISLVTNSTLTELYLHQNFITEVGAENLARMRNSTLTRLNLAYNPIRNEANPEQKTNQILQRSAFPSTPAASRPHRPAPSPPHLSPHPSSLPPLPAHLSPYLGPILQPSPDPQLIQRLTDEVKHMRVQFESAQLQFAAEKAGRLQAEAARMEAEGKLAVQTELARQQAFEAEKIARLRAEAARVAAEDKCAAQILQFEAEKTARLHAAEVNRIEAEGKLAAQIESDRLQVEAVKTALLRAEAALSEAEGKLAFQIELARQQVEAEKAARFQAEAARVEAEDKCSAQIESIRLQFEAEITARLKAEAARSEAEAARVEAEGKRAEAEVTRLQTAAQLQAEVEARRAAETKAARSEVKSREQACLQVVSSIPQILTRSDISYDKKQKLGEGGFGAVYRGSHDSTPVAVKKVIISKKNPYTADADVIGFLKEVIVMACLQSPYLVRLVGICAIPKKIMVMELMEGGSLFTRLHSKPISLLPWRTKWEILFQIARGIQFLHTNGVAHRDLKPQNILLSSDMKRVKLGDFGLSRTVGIEGHAQTLTFGGTAPYLAPEMLTSAGINGGLMCDIYAFGIIMWEVGFQKIPYSNCSRHQFDLPLLLNFYSLVRDHSFRPSIDHQVGLSRDYISLFERCWSAVAADRPTIDGILKELHLCKDQSPQALPFSSSSAPSTHVAPTSAASTSTQYALEGAYQDLFNFDDNN